MICTHKKTQYENKFNAERKRLEKKIMNDSMNVMFFFSLLAADFNETKKNYSYLD